MLLLAVMSTTKGVYSGTKVHGGISATEECLETCLAGVLSKDQINKLLDTMEKSNVLLRDTSAKGVVRLQLPFRSSDLVPFQVRYEKNDKVHSRYQMFSRDGVFAVELEKMAGDETDAASKRLKIAACCAEANSIKNRIEEIQIDLNKNAHKLGLLLVTVKDEGQYMAVQNDLATRAAASCEPRLTIALLKTPFTDDERKRWLTALTKREMATESGQTASANQFRTEESLVIAKWVRNVSGGGRIIAWNGNHVFNNIFGFANLRKTIASNVLGVLFPYAPETIVITSTAYKQCNDAAPTAGITRESSNSQIKNVLNGMPAEILQLRTIDEMAEASGNKSADSISALARVIREEMLSGQRVVLSDLWDRLQHEPFGYYNTIACGVILGYVFSAYKDSAFSWTDNAQSTHILGESTLKTMVLQMCKGTMTTDYLSAGSVTFQTFRDYAKKILALTDAQVATETECWHNMREAVTKAGAPFWTLKYLPIETYGSVEYRECAMKIVDSMQQFISQDSDREAIMSEVIQLFSGRGKLRQNLGKAFQDKNAMNMAFRTFLFSESPELEEIAGRVAVQPDELSDKLHTAMQTAIYTWTEDQVRAKLPDIISDYLYLDVLNSVVGKNYHSTQEAKRDLANLFKFLRIPLAAIEKADLPWFGALQVLKKVADDGTSQMTPESREEDIALLQQHGQKAMDCLRDAKPVLAEILELRSIDCTPEELKAVYAGLKDLSADSSLSQFDKELRSQISFISQARNRVQLIERWRTLSGEESVRSWCKKHEAPLLWIVGKPLQKMVTTLMDVQNNVRTLDQNVQNAIHDLDTLDSALLHDDAQISEVFANAVGTEYKDILEEDRTEVMTKAKFELGSDISSWGLSDLTTLQRILKKAMQDKAKREKLYSAIQQTDKMDAVRLRQRVKEFMEKHPEYCDDFLD